MKKYIHWKIIGLVLLIIMMIFTLTVLNIAPFSILLPTLVCAVVITIVNMVWGIAYGVIHDKNKLGLFCFGLISSLCILGMIYYGVIVTAVISYF